LEVLAGAKRLLAKHQPCLVVEYREDKLPEWNLGTLQKLIPYAVDVFGIPRRLGPLVRVETGNRAPGCDDLLLTPRGMVDDVHAYMHGLR
jgi:hypothetical protein